MSPALLLLFLAQVSGPVNLVANGGFEEGTKDPARWSRCDGLTTFWEKDPERPGKCLKIDSRVSNDDYHARLEEMKQADPPPAKPPRLTEGYGAVGGNDGVPYWSDWIEVKPGATYTLSVDVRSEGGKPKVFVKGYAELPFEVDEGGKAVTKLIRKVVYKVSVDAAGGARWKTSTLEFCPTRERDDVKWIRVMLYAYWPAQTYWFDNVSVVETGKDPEAPARWAARRERAAREAADEREGKLHEARLVLETVKKALERYRRDTGGYPPSLQALLEDPSPGAADSSWAGPYVLELGTDPWGNPYHYARTAAGYTLRSYGPDGEEGGGDDVE
jgi:type II secretion system protein G